MEIKIGLEKESYKGSARLLSIVLADETLLYIKP